MLILEISSLIQSISSGNRSHMDCHAQKVTWQKYGKQVLSMQELIISQDINLRSD